MSPFDAAWEAQLSDLIRGSKPSESLVPRPSLRAAGAEGVTGHPRGPGASEDGGALAPASGERSHPCPDCGTEIASLYASDRRSCVVCEAEDYESDRGDYLNDLAEDR